MAYIVMLHCYGIHSHGLHSSGRRSYGLYGVFVRCVPTWRTDICATPHLRVVVRICNGSLLVVCITQFGGIVLATQMGSDNAQTQEVLATRCPHYICYNYIGHNDFGHSCIGHESGKRQCTEAGASSNTLPCTFHRSFAFRSLFLTIVLSEQGYVVQALNILVIVLLPLKAPLARVVMAYVVMAYMVMAL